MLELSQIVAAAAAAFALAVIPGPDTMLIVGRAISNGRLIGLATSVGVATGMLFHTAMATVGLSAVLMTSSLAFQIIKWFGVAYLLYLGVQTLLSRVETHTHGESQELQIGFSKAFGQAIITNVFNPKVALFFLSFMPQFVHPSNGHVALQFLLLGLVVTIVGLVWDGFVAFSAGTVGLWLKHNATFQRWQKRVMGTIFLGLSLRLALQGQERAP
jgi:threonine/homoserine/homoserine lactone efflux protein